MKFLIRLLGACCIGWGLGACPTHAADAALADFSSLSAWAPTLPSKVSLADDPAGARLQVEPLSEGTPPRKNPADSGIFDTRGGAAPGPERSIVLQLKEPVAVPETARRVGLWIDAVKHLDLGGLWLTFDDAQGRRFEYTLRVPDKWETGWQYLDTFPFDANEMGKLHPQVGRLVGKGAGLPVRPIRLTGLRLQAKETTQGSWLLGGMEADRYALNSGLYHWALNRPGQLYFMTTTLLRSDESPYFLAGQILPQGGDSWVSWEVQAGFQGEVVGKGGKRLAFAAGDAKAQAERLPLGDLPAGDYDVVVTRRPAAPAAKEALEQTTLHLAVLSSPIASARPAPPLLSVPSGQTIQIPLPPWAGEEGEKTWKISDAKGNAVAQGMLDAAPTRWAPGAPGVYHFVAERCVNGVVVDRQTRLLGCATPPEPAGPFAGRAQAPTEDDLFGAGKNYFTWSMYDYRPDDPKFLENTRQWIRDGRAAGFDLFRIRVDWKCVEPMPGVLDFDITDRLLQEVAAQGGKAILEVRFEAPPWLDCAHQLDDHGRADLWVHDKVGINFSVWSPGMLDGVRRFTTALVLRYRSNPTLAGYHFWGMPGSGDWSTIDKPWWGQRADYSPAAVAQFNEWTRNKYAVPPTASPDWSRPDLSPGWRDWVAFRRHGLETYFLGSVLKPLRELDDRRPICAYFGLDFESEALAESARTLGWRRHTGGCELYYQVPEQAVQAWMDTGRTSPQEVHLLTPLPAGLEQATFQISAAGGGGFHWNYYWRNDIPVGTWTAEREAALAEWQKTWRPLWRELRDAGLAPPPDLACVMTYSTMHYGLRTFFTLRERDYITGTAAALYRDQLWPAWFSEDATLQGLDRFKLIVVPPSGAQVMPARLADALERYVAAGGRLALFPESGKWVTEEPDNVNALAKRLGGTFLGDAPAAASSAPSGNSGLPSSADAEIPPKSARAGAGKLFSPVQPLLFNSPVPVARSGAVVQASFDDGSPAVVTWTHGRGEVVFLAGTPVWEKVPGLMAALYKWAGGARDAGVDNPCVEINHLRKGDIHYVILHRLPDSFRPQPPALIRDELRSQPSLPAVWHIKDLPAGRWKMTELTDGNAGAGPSEVLSQQVADGIHVDMYLAQTRVFRLSPDSE